MNEYMSYEEYLEKVKTGILTEDGNCPVTPLLIMLQGKWKTQVLADFLDLFRDLSKRQRSCRSLYSPASFLRKWSGVPSGTAI